MAHARREHAPSSTASTTLLLQSFAALTGAIYRLSRISRKIIPILSSRWPTKERAPHRCQDQPPSRSRSNGICASSRYDLHKTVNQTRRIEDAAHVQPHSPRREAATTGCAQIHLLHPVSSLRIDALRAIDRNRTRNRCSHIEHCPWAQGYERRRVGRRAPAISDASPRSCAHDLHCTPSAWRRPRACGDRGTMQEARVGCADDSRPPGTRASA